MISYISHVMTLANSIIGVSVLAMPFCFKQCGIILSVIVLILCSLLSRVACHFLIKSAVMSRRRNYELLAFHAFGPMGKVLVELLIIGFLIGTCIAFFVVIGDLGPQIIGKLLNKNPEDIKLSFLLTTATLIILPLGLLKNIESLASICTVAIGFYLCLALKVIMESMGQIFTGNWYNDVNYWRPAGILQCLPIFSMALFCQTQLFEIYESIPNVSLEKMNVVVRGAINICTLVYISVGFFGYVAFCTQSFSGNILMSFDPSMTSDLMKIGFVLSVIGSFPLVIFPCRASLNSLLFRRVYMHETFTNYIPEIRFRCLTFTIITVSLITGLLMPNIEFVLGLVGSTIGVMICLIIPAAFFITISTKNTNERLLAQAILFIGMWIMILGTYANIYSVEASSTTKISVFTEKPIPQINNIQLNSNIDNNDIISKALERPINEKGKLAPSPQVELEKILEPKNFINTGNIDTHMHQITNNNNSLTFNTQEINNIMEKPKIFDENKKIQIDNSIKSEIKISNEPLSAEEKIKAIEEKEKHFEQQINENSINSDAIKKEETEIAAAADQLANVEDAERLKEKQRIENTLQQNKIETMVLLKEQKVILQSIKEQKKELEKDKKILKDLGSNKIEENILQPKVEIIDDKNNIKINNEVKINVNPKKYVAGSILDEKNKQLPINLSNNQSDVKINQRLPRIVETKELKLVKNNLDQDSVISSPNHSQALKNDNVSLESRGPILNALTNKTVQLGNIDLPSIIEDTAIKDVQNDSNPLQYAIPIALKLINPTKDDVVQAAANSVNAVDKSPVNHRDILENRIREKRDVENEIIEKNITKNINEIINQTENLECAKNVSRIKTEENSNHVKKIINTESTTSILIKTNAYLSDEKIIDNIMNVNPNSLINIGEYQIVKKRDLKSLELEKSPN